MIPDPLKKIASIAENQPLAPWTSFKIGGPARFFCSSKTTELPKLIAVAEENNLACFILGGGSNLLVSDQGFDGLVIKLAEEKIIRTGRRLVCPAGALLSRAVAEAAGAGLVGLAWAAGIPGTVGGAVRGNAGAYGGSIRDSLETAVVLTAARKEKELTRSDCRFGYRVSRFSQPGNQEIILKAVLRLAVGDSEKIKNQAAEIISRRRKKFSPRPSAGSIFKNVRLTAKEAEELVKKKLKIPKEFLEEKIIPAAWLIEAAGLKGKKIGQARISEKHGGVIVNLGRASAEEVVILISLAKQKVRQKFGLQLMEEIVYLGF